MLDTSEKIMPLEWDVLAISVGTRSIVKATSLSDCISSPVAVTTMSAAISVPDASLIPVSVKVSIVSVTTEARPSRIATNRSEEHTSELQSLMRISYAVFCLKKKKDQTTQSTKKNVKVPYQSIIS